MKKLVFLLLACVVLLACVCAMAEGASEPIKFSEGKATFTVTEADYQLLPIDFEGRDIFDLTIKGNNEKSILYTLDREGVHLVPMTAGKTKLNISSRTEKKAKLEIEVVVDAVAVEKLDEGPLKAYAMFESSYILPSDKVTLRYFVCGGTKPYTEVVITPMIRAEYGSSGGVNTVKKPKETGKMNVKFSGDARSIQPTIKVKDSAYNAIEINGNGAFIKHTMTVTPEYMLFECPAGEKVEIPYTISGGSGNYSIVEEVFYFNSDRNEVMNDTIKKNGKGEEVFSFAPPAVEGFLQVRIRVQDKKTKEVVCYTPETIQCSSGLIKGTLDKMQALVDEPITLTIEYDQTPEFEPEVLDSGYFMENGVIDSDGSTYIKNGNTEPTGVVTRTVEKVSDKVYKVIFTAHVEGEYWFSLISDAMFVHRYSSLPFITVTK